MKDCPGRRHICPPYARSVSLRHDLVFGMRAVYNFALRVVDPGCQDQPTAMTKPVKACCSSPASICYWFIVSLVAWGVLSLVGIYWRPLHASPEATCLFAMAVGCLANWRRNRTFHCAITGPLFVIAGVVFLLSGARITSVNTRWVWPAVFIGVGIAFLLERLYAQRSAS